MGKRLSIDVFDGVEVTGFAAPFGRRRALLQIDRLATARVRDGRVGV